jgi:predicted Zn-dependent protease
MDIIRAGFLLGQFLVIAALVSHTGCSSNPVTGEPQLALVSEEEEIEIGEDLHERLAAQFGIVEDQQLQAYVQEVGQRIARSSHRPDLDWHFAVIDIPVVNAVALPGGYVYVSREMMAYINDEAELAGVLAHEVAHVAARHAVERMSRMQLAQIGLTLGTVFSLTLAQLTEAAEAGLGLLFLKYSRDDEREADALGIEYMTESGYDPRRLPSFIRVLQDLQRGPPGLPSWLSTHPDLAERVSLAWQEADEVLEDHNEEGLAVARDRYLEEIDGLVYGPDPRDGFVHRNTFVHPGSGFKLQFPQGWIVQSTRTAVVAMPPGGGAIMRLTTATGGLTPEQHARQLEEAPEVEEVESQEIRIDGNPGLQAVFRVADGNDEGLVALVGLISFRQDVYQVTGFTSRANFPALRGTFESAVNSFRRLTTPELRNVEPSRILLTRARQGETLRRLAAEDENSPVSLEELARLNRLDPDKPLPAGFPVKMVRQGRGPG